VRFLSFKDKYTFEIYQNLGEPSQSIHLIEINPVERILQGLKVTTLRVKRNRPRIYQVRQGNYKKPIIAPFRVNIWKVEPRLFPSLSLKEIQTDIGLSDSEFRVIEESQVDSADLPKYFLEKFQEISGIKTFDFESVAYLHYLKVNYPNEGQTLNKFMKR